LLDIVIGPMSLHEAIACSDTDLAVLDAVQFAIGEFNNIKPALQIQRRNVPVEYRDTKEIIGTVKLDVPDLVIATGTLRGSPITQEGATFYFRLRRGPRKLGSLFATLNHKAAHNWAKFQACLPPSKP